MSPKGCCGGSKDGTCCGGQKKSSTTDTTTTNNNASVPLPKTAHTKAKVWQLSTEQPRTRSRSPSFTGRVQQLESMLADDQPLGSKCGAPHRADGQCCKDLKGDDERTLISPEIVRDIIIGLSDGLTVPFALTAGLSSIGSSRLVVLGGLAELCAGAISMGLGGYLASQAELDHFHYLRKQTHARVIRSCAGEMEREVHSILGPLGVEEPLSRLVAEGLRNIEDDISSADGTAVEGVYSSSSPSPRFQDEEDGEGLKFSEGVGLTAFLLKFGEGIEEVPRSRLYISALTIGLSYFVGGLIPLLPYIFTKTAHMGLIISVILTGIILLIFGAFKTYFTGAEGGWKGYTYGSFSTMLVGGLAAGAAFLLVRVMDVHD
ncbi:vacuolar iron transporter family protein, partial [Tremellales sp. Uapishka_1]